jgi:type IV secretory pathway TrbF-like protein
MRFIRRRTQPSGLPGEKRRRGIRLRWNARIGEGRAQAVAAAAVLGCLLVASPATAADQLYFSAKTNVTNILVNYINHENVRLDISSWYLSEHAISIAIANRFAAGVRVRIIGDRAAIFEADPHT